MDIKQILLMVCFCLLTLCIGMLIGIFIEFKIDHKYICDFFNTEKDFFNKMDHLCTEYINNTTNMILESQKKIAGWIDEINKNCYIPIWKYVEKELPECDGIYYGKKDNTNSMWKVIFKNNEWYLSGYPDQKIDIIKWTELY